MSYPEYDENLDFSQFDFDLNIFNDFLPISNTHPEQYFNLSPFDQQPATGFQPDRPFGHDPLIADQYAFDRYASAQGGGLSALHTRPHHSDSSQDSGQLDSSFFDGFQFTESRSSQPTPSSQDPGSFNESNRQNQSDPHPPIPLQQNPQATALMLRLATPLLARALPNPNPNPAQIAVMTAAAVACQCLLLSSWITGLNYLATAALAFMMKNQFASLGGHLSVRPSLPPGHDKEDIGERTKTSLRTPFPAYPKPHPSPQHISSRPSTNSLPVVQKALHHLHDLQRCLRLRYAR